MKVIEIPYADALPALLEEVLLLLDILLTPHPMFVGWT